MRWTIEQIHQLAKKVCGNQKDEQLLKKAEEMNSHLKNYEESFLGLHNKHEWAEVERLADDINRMMRKSLELSKPQGILS